MGIRKRLILYLILLLVLLTAIFLLFSHDRNNAINKNDELAVGVQDFFNQIKSEANNPEYSQEIDAASVSNNTENDFSNLFSDVTAQNATVSTTNTTKVSSSKVAKINDYTILGVITINKINIQYPIIQYINSSSLNVSICKYTSNKKLNDLGNVAIVGHNMLSGIMFHNLDKLVKGDKILITDAKGKTITYQVYDTSVVNPNDTDCLKTTDLSKREVTLITCTTANFSKRLIVKAMEVWMKAFTFPNMPILRKN